MSILFTADIQAEWSNLDTCEEMWNEVLSISRKNNVDLICVLGDLKNVYNPVDVRIIQWWQSAIRRIKHNGIEILILLGNHDRVGAYNSADNWLSILRRAGAHTFDKPNTFKWHDTSLYLLSYQNESGTRLGAVQCKEALSRTHSKYNILLFHQDISGVSYNMQGSKSNSKLTEDDLFCSKYDYCVGGHIHCPQRFGKKQNIFYVGSPFCHDFGEVNQIKRYLVLK